MWSKAELDTYRQILVEEQGSSLEAASELGKYVYHWESFTKLREEYPRDSIFKANKRTKMKWNEHSNFISSYEGRAVGTPIYDKMVKTLGEQGLPDFLKEDSLRKAREIKFENGWYQNSRGDLFHYDGTVWDVLPDEPFKSLGYLGGK